MAKFAGAAEALNQTFSSLTTLGCRAIREYYLAPKPGKKNLLVFNSETKMPSNLMQKVTKSLGKQWGRLEGEEVERRGEGRLAAWREEEEKKLRPVDRWHLEEEARRVTRRMRAVGRRLEEEQVVREEMKAREKVDKAIKERLEEERKLEESERVARNREWRMKRETEECSR